MDNSRPIDITFDFRSDTPQGRDPDALSPTLRRYHKLLWSKPLPSNEGSPLGDTLARYADYFRLFGDFRGYVEFFLLQDLVTDDCAAVKFFLPFNGFNSSPVPDSMAAYLDYRALAVDFIEARNQRIQTWWTVHRLANNRLQRTALRADAEPQR